MTKKASQDEQYIVRANRPVILDKTESANITKMTRNWITSLNLVDISRHSSLCNADLAAAFQKCLAIVSVASTPPLSRNSRKEIFREAATQKFDQRQHRHNFSYESLSHSTWGEPTQGTLRYQINRFLRSINTYKTVDMSDSAGTSCCFLE